MTLAHPAVLYLLALVPLLGLLLAAAASRHRGALARFGNPELLARAGMAVSGPRRGLKLALLLLALILMIVALAQPQWGASREKIERKGVDVVVVFDTSLSMLAQDVAPSRMAKAKAAVVKLIDLMKGDRIGIVVFSGAAFTICPLTLDYSAARMFLDVIDIRAVPEPGTDIPAALREAAANFDAKTDKYKAVIVISDGENLDNPDDDPAKAAEELAKQGIRIFTVGVGDPKGSSIPVETKEGTVDKVDREGKVVITKLDEDSLRKIALAGKGQYKRLDNRASGDELAEIYADVARMEKKTFEEDYQVHYEDRFQYFVAAAFILLALEPVIPDRRKRS